MMIKGQETESNSSAERDVMKIIQEKKKKKIKTEEEKKAKAHINFLS